MRYQWFRTEVNRVLGSVGVNYKLVSDDRFVEQSGCFTDDDKRVLDRCLGGLMYALKGEARAVARSAEVRTLPGVLKTLDQHFGYGRSDIVSCTGDVKQFVLHGGSMADR
jgi:hypothetical protein